MQFREHRLENGLEIIAEVNPRAHSLGMAFFVKTGARDEIPSLAGVSHFLEHMVFKGTPRRTADDVNRELDEIGAQSNAFTSEEQTVYYAVVLPEHQQRTLDLLADIMRPSLRAEDFETEKQVIIEEIGKYDDQPPFGGHERSMEAYFGNHSLSRRVLGTAETVRAMSPQQMMQYFQQRYSPANMVLAAAGDVDFDRFVAQAEELCGPWQPFEAPRDTSPPQPNFTFEVMHKPESAQEYVISLAPGPAANDGDRYASRIAATIIGDDSGSRLYWDLVETGLADFAVVSPCEYQGCGLMISFLCSPPENAESNLAHMHAMLREAERGEVSADELERAKTKISSHIVLQSERTSRRLFSVGSNWIQRSTYETVKETVAKYQVVTAADVAAVLQKYPLTRSCTVAVGPLETLKLPTAP